MIRMDTVEVPLFFYELQTKQGEVTEYSLLWRICESSEIQEMKPANRNRDRSASFMLIN